jgi:hypothetical protein
MAHSLQDFFAYLHTEVTLPVSQLTVLIRKPDLMAFVGLGRDLPIPTTTPSPETPPSDALAPVMTVQDINRYTERVIAEGVISPPMSDVRDDQGRPIYSKLSIHVSELAEADKTFLAQTLFEKLGLTPEVATGIEAFRPDAERPDAEGISGTLSNVALANTEAE